MGTEAEVEPLFRKRLDFVPDVTVCVLSDVAAGSLDVDVTVVGDIVDDTDVPLPTGVAVILVEDSDVTVIWPASESEVADGVAEREVDEDAEADVEIVSKLLMQPAVPLYRGVREGLLRPPVMLACMHVGDIPEHCLHL